MSLDTIFALATPPGKSGVAVVRVSGPKAFLSAAELSGASVAPRKVLLRELRNRDGDVIDSGVILGFAEGASFTGEQVVEFQVHGSPAVVEALLVALENLDGMRPAEAGEFTRQALLNGRMDLLDVEALGDLIDAETQLQRVQAQEGLAGRLKEEVAHLRGQIVRVLALIEAGLDFSDEDVPADVSEEVLASLDGIGLDLNALIAGAAVSERLRTGFEVAILGPPNVGKSTLLNRLAGRKAAITSEIAGTTRDIIEVRMDLGGIPVTFLDTAGIRTGRDPVEDVGIALAKARAKAADLRIWLTDIEADTDAGFMTSDDIFLHAKGDLTSHNAGSISGLTGLGVPALLNQIEEILKKKVAARSSAVRPRHRTKLNEALARIAVVKADAENLSEHGELASFELYEAIKSLDQLIGRVDVEDVLDDIFASFCIGK